MRKTFDFGIDLGIENSCIAVFNGSGVDVIKNNEGQEYTPSAVWIDSKGKLYVGRLAKERLEDDSENAFCEFKLQMGKDTLYRFARSGRHMRPEELSAEVLKSLRGDVIQRTGEQVTAAVISVPAAFEPPQTNATVKAARLAGLEHVLLIQEPVAAAIAYGFESNSNGVFWMVYDLGGGTFNVAVIQLWDGKIEIVNHAGDNNLGVKLVDWDIVDKIFVPALTKKYRLSDFNRANPRWKSAFAKLKLHAKNAQIQLARDDETSILIESFCQDDRGALVKFEYDIKRGEVEMITEPLVERSVNLCQRVLQESHLLNEDIEKITLVGESTLYPFVRDIISRKLRIPLDFSIDPATAVAQGAAIFAGGIRMPENIPHNQREIKEGQYSIELEYKPISNETDSMIGGKVIGEKDKSLAGFTIEIVEKKTYWRSGKISLNAGDIFTAVIRAAEPVNEFLIELRDPQGNICRTMPDHFNISHSIGELYWPLVNSIGIALPNGQMLVFIPKGTLLPARKREILHTTKELKRGETGELLKIAVVEGEYTRRADRNRLIGSLEIDGSALNRDVPPGSEVEITIMIDESRIVTTKAYIPIIDEEFENVLKFFGQSADPQKMAVEFSREKDRFEKACIAAQNVGVNQSRKALHKIQDEDMTHEIESLLVAAQTDPDAAEKCSKYLLDFEIAIDEIEEATQNIQSL